MTWKTPVFNLALERAIRDSKVDTSGIIFYKSTQILAYADDTDIIGLRLSYVAEAYQGIEQAAENLALQINAVTTKLMMATSAALRFWQASFRFQLQSNEIASSAGIVRNRQNRQNRWEPSEILRNRPETSESSESLESFRIVGIILESPKIVGIVRNCSRPSECAYDFNNMPVIRSIPEWT